MTGTSMDALDVVIVGLSLEEIQDHYKEASEWTIRREEAARFKLIAKASADIPQTLREELELCIELGSQIDPNQPVKDTLSFASAPNFFEKLLTAQRKLTELAGDVFQQCLVNATNELGFQPIIAACGCHGQTIYHMPAYSSWQLFDSALFAVRNKVKVISQFRDRDIAHGGQGAPLVPKFHEFLFRKTATDSCVVNIGGIANISAWKDRLVGWDIGPGNRLLDAWVQRYFNASYDKDGTIAKSGSINHELLKLLQSEPYFAEKGAKSTGRERFNLNWLFDFEEHSDTGSLHELPKEDVLATLTELSAWSIGGAVTELRVENLILCGGGAKNAYLVERIDKYTPGILIKTAEAFGFDSQMIEGMAFAFFAALYDLRICGAIASVTGASQDSICGTAFEP